jgi:hydrogenase nickel incorporation protein HypA/HybF
MHESSLMVDLLWKIESVVRDQAARRAVAVQVKLGALANISPEHFHEHFVLAARGTSAEGARLDIQVVPGLTDPRAQQIVLESVEVEG